MSNPAMGDLLKINVNEHTERKGQLTYLSWAWAWAEVLKFDPGATWHVHLYGPEGQQQPCMWIGETAMVHTTVSIYGHLRDCMLPVMDNKNNAVKNPDARKISDAIMRCMTKAIAMHGLGLYIYAGEDLPQADDPPTDSLEPVLKASIEQAKAKRTGVMADVLAGLPPLSPEDESYFAELAENLEDLLLSKGAAVAYDRVHAEGLDSEQTLWLWSKLGSKLRAALKTEKASRVGTVAA